MTGGLVWGPAKLEASAFNGREPDAARWNFERPRFDSRAARLTVNPRPWLSAQVSAAELRAPEILHPTIDVRRYTASVSYAGGGHAAPPGHARLGTQRAAAPTCPRRARCSPRGRR